MTDDQLTAFAERFCATPLPDSVCADLVAIKPMAGRYGTNLMTVVEAKQMLAAVLSPTANVCSWCPDGCGWYTSYNGGVAHWRHCDYCNSDAVTKPDPRTATPTPTIPAGMVAEASFAEKIEAEARRYAGMYPQNSDGRNTFVIFADYIAKLSLAAAPKQAEQQGVKALRDAAQAMVDAYDEDPDSEAVCDARNGLVAALNAPTGAVEPTARQRALADMVALDEEIEANHPGWMTGAVEKGEAK